MPPQAEKLILEALRFEPEVPSNLVDFVHKITVMEERAGENETLGSALSIYKSAAQMILDEPRHRILLVSTASILTPPDNYGGMERMVAYLAAALKALGNDVGVIAKTGSTVPGLVGSALIERDFPEIGEVVLPDYEVMIDLSHDKMIGRRFPDYPQLNVYQVMSVGWRKNPVFISQAQKNFIGIEGPVVYYGLDKADYPLGNKDYETPYLLYMGSIIPEKRVEWAIAIAELIGMPIMIAGPHWVPEYWDGVIYPLIEKHPWAHYVGDVGGQQKLKLLQGADGLVHPVGAGGWVEAGAIVAQEAATVGTPLLVSDNGCLPEYVEDFKNGVIGTSPSEIADKARTFFAKGYDPVRIRRSVSHLSSLSMAWNYLDLIGDVLGGENW
jgi:glycosyltransferase involved in cell wall biosynthesis